MSVCCGAEDTEQSLGSNPRASRGQEAGHSTSGRQTAFTHTLENGSFPRANQGGNNGLQEARKTKADLNENKAAGITLRSHLGGGLAQVK